MSQLPVIAPDEEPRLPGAWGQHHRPAVGDPCLFAIAERIAGHTEAERNVGIVGIEAARFLENLARSCVIAQAMADSSQPQPGEGLGARDIDRGLVANKRLPNVPLRL